MNLLTLAWLVFAAVWGIAAIRSKPVARREPISSRVKYMAPLFAASASIFPGHHGPGPLFTTGAVLVWAGIALAIWARVLLGGNWSGTVTIKQGHELVRRGPYVLVRHPIYSGILLALLGTAVAFGAARGYAGVAIAMAAFYYKARTEERYLREQFGAEYERYQRETKALVPFVL